MTSPATKLGPVGVEVVIVGSIGVGLLLIATRCGPPTWPRNWPKQRLAPAPS